jgi:hypothetical protein
MQIIVSSRKTVKRLIKQSKFSNEIGGVMRGGKRPGAGRKSGSVSAAKTRLQQTAKDVAAQVLSEVDAVAIWKQLILQQEKPQVVASVMEYLTDRVHGRPTETIQGNPEQPVTIQLQRFLHAGMADDESAGESHHHVNGSILAMRSGNSSTGKRIA